MSDSFSHKSSGERPTGRHFSSPDPPVVRDVMLPRPLSSSDEIPATRPKAFEGRSRSLNVSDMNLSSGRSVVWTNSSSSIASRRTVIVQLIHLQLQLQDGLLL